MALNNTSVASPLALDNLNEADRDLAVSQHPSGLTLPGILQALASPSSAPQSLIIVDPSVDWYEMLLDGVLDETQAFVLDDKEDAIAQITALLRTHQPISELHLVSHGAPGQLQFSNVVLSDANLNRYSTQLQQWQTYFAENAQLVLYGCEVALGQTGQNFLQQLSHLTGLSSIAANSQPTGNKARGGTWSLSNFQPFGKTSASAAAVSLAFATETLDAYPGLLTIFFNQQTFGVGSYPVSVAVGDLNGDSIPDVVASNAGFGDETVSVLLGDGSGGLSADTKFAMGDAPYSAILADFNGDSNLDVATTSRFGQVVSIRLGDGNGGLGSRSFFTVGGRLSRPNSVTAGDFNGDSILDLAVVKVFEDQLSVFRGDGSGGFGSRANFVTDKYPNSVITADFNGDSILDLAVANRGNNNAGNGDNISIRLGNGSGGFGAQSTFAAGNRAYDIAAGDFNGDSILDLVSTNEYANSISVLLGDGSGGFGTQSTYSAGNSPYAVAVGDLDNDSDLDIVVTNYGSDSISIFEGDGSGGFDAQQTIAAVDGPHDVAIEDLNDDGLLDLVVANFNDQNVEVFLNDGSNDAPTITSPATASVLENQTSAIDVQSTDDSDSEGSGLTYSLSGGADQALFNLDSSSGVLTFAAAPDFEAPGDANADNDYLVQVTVTDSGGLTDVQDLTISVTDEVENTGPTITSPATASVSENQTSAIDVQSTDDNDSEGSGLTYSLSGGADQALFNLDSSSGVLTFAAAPDFEAPGDANADNDYLVQVTV
ncbi:MAG: DUF4347 domain-containing protein, partial [Synechococcus sp.]